jgi:phospholipase A-2-activating protein
MTAMFNKILTTNKNMISSGRKDVAMNPGDEQILLSLKAALEGNKAISPKGLDLVVRIVSQWPYTDRLAGLDLLRCMARYPIVGRFSNPEHESLIDLAMTSSVPNDTTPNEHAAMMGVRTVVNLFGSAEGRSVANTYAGKSIAFMERIVGVKGGEPIGKDNRNALIAVSTTAINYAVLVNKEKLLVPDQRRRLLVVLGVILREQSNSEVLYRSLVALGTLLATSKDEATKLGISSWIKEAAGRSDEDRVKSVAIECAGLAPRQ